MQRSNELHLILGQILRQVRIQMQTQQDQRDRIGVSYINGLDVVIDADMAHGVNDLQRVVKALLGCGRLAVHVFEVRLNLLNERVICV